MNDSKKTLAVAATLAALSLPVHAQRAESLLVDAAAFRKEVGGATGERSNRAYAANRPEETRGERVVARWKAALRKTGMAMVHFARGLAWSWVTSSTLVNRSGGSQPPGRYPV